MGSELVVAVTLLAVAAGIVAVAFRINLPTTGAAPLVASGIRDSHNVGHLKTDETRTPPEADARYARTLAEAFFAPRRCAICGLAIAEPPVVRHPPALRAPDGVTIEWSQLPPDRLVAALKTHDAVCWNCHVAEEFRRLYPQLVTDRPEHHATA